MKRVGNRSQSGYTLVEVMMALFIIAVIATSIFTLFTALVNSSLLMKRKSVALSLATSQMEYLKSLPYDSLAVSGGSIVASSYIPATTQATISGTRYTITTSINYADEAYDGCGSYPTQALKEKYCRNYPPPASAPATDSNPGDTKVVHVKVADTTGMVLSDVDTQIAARVAETASSTGALFVHVVDDNGNPLPGATVRVTNSTTSPTVDATDATDQNGIAIFYALPPDTTQFDYVVSASLAGYSSLFTISPSGSLQPIYSNVKIFAQQSSYVTLELRPMAPESLLIETVDTNGNPLGNVTLYAKGGYKKYTSSTNTNYYYDNVSPADIRVTTDASGIAVLESLVPGPYYFCGDGGTTSCAIGGTQYHMAAAVPYGGDSALSPIVVPTYRASSPPSETYPYNGKNYLQKVRIIMSPQNNYPRLTTLTPAQANLSAANISAFPFEISGSNLPCGNNPASCNTTVVLRQGTSSFTASCSGTADGLLVECTVDLSGAAEGMTYLEVTNNSYTFTLPSTLKRAGIEVVP
jgi:prepilin-type N-terminal cleavage/methylation domain-containing protein